MDIMLFTMLKILLHLNEHCEIKRKPDERFFPYRVIFNTKLAGIKLEIIVRERIPGASAYWEVDFFQ